MKVVRVMVLGPVAVDGEHQPSPRDRVVLAALTVSSREVVTVATLIDAMWGDRPPPSATKVVHGCVMRLRRSLGEKAVETVAGGYRLAVPPDEIDARRFETLVRRGMAFRARGEVDRAAHALATGLDLWRGPAYGDLEWEPCRVEADRLAEMRLDAQEAYLASALEASLPLDLVAEARAQVSAAPLREKRWATLAHLQYRSGCQGDALATLRRARRVLAQELGLDPGPELVALEQAILRQDVELLLTEPAATEAAACPYVGLLPYDVGDAASFHGRDGDVTACLRRLAETGVAVVVGPSGSGKSSLLRAGVVAALADTQRQPLVITPGEHPMASLAAVEHGAGTTVLAVDQCEEILTLCDDEGEARLFLDALVQRAEEGSVVVALRSDKLEGLAGHPGFARLVERGLYLLGALGERELREAVEGPAAQAGLAIEPGLTDLLVQEVAGQPGALPMLSHALRETWLRREGRTMTLAGYHATGGIRKAIARTAEGVYDSTPAEERTLLRDLVLRLVTRGEEGLPMSTPVARPTFATPDRARLLERLVDARLVTADEQRVGLAHEALAESWPRLHTWLEEDVAGQRILRHLATAAASWTEMGRPDSELYRGARLALALEWREQRTPDLTADEEDFLDASADGESQTLRAAQLEVRSRRRSQRRLRSALVGVGVLLLVVATLSVLALRERSRAEHHSVVADARRLGALAATEPSYDLALLQAVAAVRLWDSPETRGNLLSTIERNPLATRVLRTSGSDVVDFAIAPNGDRGLVVDADDDVWLHDLTGRSSTGREVAALRSTELSYRAPAYSPDGRYVAVTQFESRCWAEACDDFVVEVRDAADLELVESLHGFGPAAELTFSADGRLLAAAAPFAFVPPEDNVAVWELGSSSPPHLLTLHEPGADLRPTPESDDRGWLRFAPGGRVVYASGAAAAAAIDVATGETLRTFPGLGALELSPDGSTLVVATALDRAALVDARTGELHTRLGRQDTQVVSARFSPDGRSVVTTGVDGTAHVWDTGTGERLHVLRGHAGNVPAAGFAPDGSTVFTAGADRSVIAWDLSRTTGLARDQVQAHLTEAPPEERSVLLSPDASSALLVGERIDVLDTASGRIASDVPIPHEARLEVGSAFTPDGTRFANLAGDGVLRLVDLRTGEVTARAALDDVTHGAVAVAPDTGTVVTGTESGLVEQFDPTTLEPTGHVVRLGRPVHGIRAAPGGLVAAVSSGLTRQHGTDITFARLDEPGSVRRVHVPLFGVLSTFNADGTLFAMGDISGRLAVIDVATGDVKGPGGAVHSALVSSVAYHGNDLVSVDAAGDMVLSDGRTGETRAVVHARTGRVLLSVAVPRGSTAVIAGADGSVSTYDLDSDAWLAHACAVAGRDLTRAEWTELLGSRPYDAVCR